jgi:hypothetical protein
MKRNKINAAVGNLSTDDLMSCYQAAYDKLDPEDQETVIACVDRLMKIKNMGIASAWELASKLGIFFLDQKVLVDDD